MDLNLTVHGENNQGAKLRVDCRGEGLEAERPVRTLLEYQAVGVRTTQRGGGQGGWEGGECRTLVGSRLLTVHQGEQLPGSCAQ